MEETEAEADADSHPDGMSSCQHVLSLEKQNQ